MKIFIAQARKCLPEEAIAGTLFKIAIEKQTGRLTNIFVSEDNENYQFYKFLRTSDKWIYLGNKAIPEKYKHLYNDCNGDLGKDLP